MRTEKTGGRTKGVPNKVTQELRQWLQLVIDKNKEQFETDLAKVEPEKRLLVIEKLIGYIVPKPQSLDIQLEYRHLEALLQKTPEAYIEQISQKLIELHVKTKDHEENE